MGDPGLIVAHPGLFTTVQDRGRPGYRGFGVPVGGAADRESFDLANALLGNDVNDAALEFSVMAGSYLATDRLAVALTGTPFRVSVDSASACDNLRIPCCFTLKAGDVIRFDRPEQGAQGVCGYLAVAGGLQTPLILGSRSSEIRLKFGDFLPAKSSRTATCRPVITPGIINVCDHPIRVIDGPDSRVPEGFLTQTWVVDPQSNRVGIRLKGQRLDGFVTGDRPSAPLAVGAVQIAGGLPLIIGVAGGTMGGYPHVAHIISADLDRLAQVPASGKLLFTPVSLAEAVELGRQHRKEIARRDFWVRLGRQNMLG